MNGVRRGFTLVELIVVIGVIGIIAAVTIVGLSRFQADTRDTRRASSATVIAESLEKYYDQNGEYPSCTAIQQSSSVVVGSILKGVQTSVLTAPNATSGTNSLSCSVLSYTSPTDFFEYLGDGSTDCQTTGCLYFAIRYKDEATESIKTVESRHSPNIQEPENIAAVVDSSTQVTVTWDASDNASGYSLQRSTSDTFPSDSSTTTYSQTGTSKVFTDEAPGLTHYYRVAATSGPATSRWSDIVHATPAPLAPTNLVATTNSSTQQTLTWTASANATSYKLERSLSNTFSSPIVVDAAVTGTSKVVTGLTQGQNHYYRVTAIANGTSSVASSIANAMTNIDAPAAFTITCTTNTTTVSCTSNAVCAAGTTAYYLWMTDGNNWQMGETYQSVSYTPAIQDSVTLSNSVMCYNYTSNPNGYYGSTFTDATNTKSYTRPLPVPTISTLQRNGSRVWAKWNNVCGGIYQLYLVQGSYTETTYPHWNSTNNPWTSSGVVEMQSSENDTRAWSSTATVTYKVRAKCNGSWGAYSSAKSV